VGPRAGLDRCGKPRPTRIRFSSPWPVVTPTALSRLSVVVVVLVVVVVVVVVVALVVVAVVVAVAELSNY
jgi:hypothetical protein